MKQLLIFIAALALCQVASGKDEETDEELANYMAQFYAHIFFFNACEGMAYNVTISGKASTDSALSESEIANAIESRLRAARIYQDEYQHGHGSVFNVSLTLAGNAAMLSVGFEKPGFVDPYLKHHLLAKIPWGMETWGKTWLVQGGDSGDVLAQLSKYLNEFISNYLRVNSDDACEEYRVAELEHEAYLEAERAAEKAKTDAWKDWSADTMRKPGGPNRPKAVPAFSNY